MSYFRAGFWHFVLAVLWAVALTAVSGEPLLAFPNDDPFFWLRRPGFLAALLASSSALFFVPDAWAKKGLMKFLHYPLPDWDVLLLGPASHRHWLFHSPVLPLFAMLCVARFPGLLAYAGAISVGAGLCTGIGAHLFWDCVGSRRHSIVIVPYAWTLRERASRLYLLVGAAVAGGCALFFVRLA